MGLNKAGMPKCWGKERMKDLSTCRFVSLTSSLVNSTISLFNSLLLLYRRHIICFASIYLILLSAYIGEWHLTKQKLQKINMIKSGKLFLKHWKEGKRKLTGKEWRKGKESNMVKVLLGLRILTKSKRSERKPNPS